MSEQDARRLAEQTRREVEQARSARAEYIADLATTARRTPPPAPAPGAEEPVTVVLNDTSLPTETRVEVLNRLAATLTRRSDHIETLVAIVSDRTDDPEVREAALRVLGSAAMQVARFRPHRTAYDDALRALVTDPVADLRETAVSTLALERDPVIQETLTQGLRGDGDLPVARERAILLLAEDDHLDNLPWLRELYGSDDADLRQEAVRFMGSYPQARETLEGVLRDKGEAAGVRQQSAASLRHLAPERFEAIAKDIATDTTDDPEVRTACLSTLQHLGDTERIYADGDFVRRVRDIVAGAATSAAAGPVAAALLGTLRGIVERGIRQ